MPIDIAATSVITSGVVGFGGLALGLLNGSKDRRNSRDLARDDRQAGAYVAVLEIAERVGHWAQLIYPIADSIPPNPVPPLPPLEDQARVEALSRAFGSRDVRRCAREWRETVTEMMRDCRLIALADSMPDGGVSMGIDSGTIRARLGMELRPQEAAKRELIAEQVAKELGHRP